MIDISKTIEPRSDQLNADDLAAGPRTVTIREVRGTDENADQPISIFFDGDNGRPFKPCKSMRRVMVHVWGKDGATYVGKSMTLYCDPKVKFGGIEVGGIRISHMSDIKNPVTVPLTVTRGKRAPFRIEPLKDAPQAQAGAPKADAPVADLDAAGKAAGRGTEAFRAWWNTPEAKAARAALAPHLEDLKAICAKADAEMDDDPFGLPKLDDDKPTPEEMAKAEEQARAAAAENEREAVE